MMRRYVVRSSFILGIVLSIALLSPGRADASLIDILNELNNKVRLLTELVMKSKHAAQVVPNVAKQDIENLAPGKVIFLGEYSPEPVSGCSYSATSITDYSGFVYDSSSDALLMFGGGHAAAPRTDVDRFDLRGPYTWVSQYPITPLAEQVHANHDYTNAGWISTGHPTTRHTYDQLVYAPNTRELIMLHQADGKGIRPRCGSEDLDQQYPWQGGVVWHYNPSSKQWSKGGPLTYTNLGNGEHGSSEYDPESGKIITISTYGLYTYDPVTKVQVKHMSLSQPFNWQSFVYYPPTKNMYVIRVDGRVFEVKLNRSDFSKTTILEVAVTGEKPNFDPYQGSGFAYDPEHKIFAGGVKDGYIYVFDPNLKEWSKILPDSVSAEKNIGSMKNMYTLAYVSSLRAFVFLSYLGNYKYGTWAYKYAPTVEGNASVSGVCGGAHNVPVQNPPVQNLCATGEQTSVNTSLLEFTWQCLGSGGGQTASCQTPRMGTGTTTPPPPTSGILVGELRHDGPPTPEQIALYMPVIGPLSQNAVATTRYRVQGQGWKEGHKLLRIRSEHAEGNPSDAFAWPLVGLLPGTSYEIEVTVSLGNDRVVKTLMHTTRSLPKQAGSVTKRIAGGSNSQFIQATFDSLVPGDVLEFEEGTYNVNNLILRRSGSDKSPIYIRGASREGVVLNDSTETILMIGDASNVVIENITLKGSGVDSGVGAVSKGILFHTSATQRNITLRNLMIDGIDVGIKAYGEIEGALIYGNLLKGNNRWDQDFYAYNGTGNPGSGDGTRDVDQNIFWNDDGITITGWGNVAFNNTLSGFGDSFAFATYSTNKSYGLHIYRNEVRNSGDDLLEADYATRNLTFYDNRSHNSMTALSLDPLYGGPLVYARNIIINAGRAPFKWNSTNSGHFVYNNTIVRTARGGNADYAAWYQPNNGDQRTYGYQNNILIYRGGGTLLWLDNGGHDPVDWSHNSWYPDRRVAISRAYGGWNTLALAQSGIPQSTPVFSGITKRLFEDSITTSDPFKEPIVLGGTHLEEVKKTYLPVPQVGSTLRTSGIHIPNITDGFSGVKPDRGAVVSGLPLISYGVEYVPPANVPPSPRVEPELVLNATKNTLGWVTKATVAWTGKNVSSCTASNGWLGNRATSGVETIAIQRNTTFGLECSGDSGKVYKEIRVTVDQTPVPPINVNTGTTSPVRSIDLKATYEPTKGTVFLSWSRPSPSATYIVERCLNSKCTKYNRIKVTKKNEYYDANLKKNKQYQYRVRTQSSQIVSKAAPVFTGKSTTTGEQGEKDGPSVSSDGSHTSEIIRYANAIYLLPDLEVLGTVYPGVLSLQKFLNRLGFSVASTGPGSLNNENERYGPGTKNALLKFQAAHGLPQTGILGPMTRGLIYERYSRGR